MGRGGGQRLGFGDEVAGGIVEQAVDRPVLPGGGELGVDGLGIADVALEPARPSGKVVVEFGRRFLEHALPPAADDDMRAEFEEPSALRRSEEHTSELQSLMRISYSVFC